MGVGGMVHLFLINSFAGSNRFTSSIRECLSKREDIEYYILHIRKKHGEKDIVDFVVSVFEGESLRIYCCGGSGTFRNIINSFPSFDNVEFAFFPRGLTNDFLKCFGDNASAFSDLNALIDGRATMIDCIRTNHGTCLNSISAGLDSLHSKKANELISASIFGRNVPYNLALLYAMLFTKPEEYEISLGSKMIKGKFSQLIFCNGQVFGGNLWVDTEGKACDGLGTYAIFGPYISLGMIPAILSLLGKNNEKINKYAEYGKSDSITIRRKDGKAFSMNMDGEMQPDYEEWSISIDKKALPFVLPKGVEY